MKPTLDARVIAPDHVLAQELEGEAVLLNLQSERYYSLDDIGTRMWNTLTTAPSISAAHSALLEEYDVDAERLEQDLLDLVEKLVTDGLVELREA